MNGLQSAIDFLNNLLAAPLGQTAALIVVITIIGYFVSLMMASLLKRRALEVKAVQDKLNAELEKQRLDNEQKEDERRAASNANIYALLREMTTLQERLTRVVERLEPKLSENTDLLKTTKDNTESIAIRAAAIHKDLRSSTVTLAGKIDNMSTAASKHFEESSIIANNRAQEMRKSIDSTEKHMQGILTEQNAMLDQVLQKVIEVGKELTGLRTDFKDNNTAHFAAIEVAMREMITSFEKFKKRGTEPLDPAKAPVEPLAQPTVLAALNLSITEPPAAFTPQDAPLVTPPDKHDTHQFAASKPEAT